MNQTTYKAFAEEFKKQNITKDNKVEYLIHSGVPEHIARNADAKNLDSMVFYVDKIQKSNGNQLQNLLRKINPENELIEKFQQLGSSRAEILENVKKPEHSEDVKKLIIANIGTVGISSNLVKTYGGAKKDDAKSTAETVAKNREHLKLTKEKFDEVTERVANESGFKATSKAKDVSDFAISSIGQINTGKTEQTEPDISKESKNLTSDISATGAANAAITVSQAVLASTLANVKNNEPDESEDYNQKAQNSQSLKG